MYPNSVKIEVLEKTKAFYNRKLKDKNLTEKQRSSYLLAKKIIEKIIREKEGAGEEKGKRKKLILLDK